MNSVDPTAWLTQTRERIANQWPSAEIDALMPWNYTPLNGHSFPLPNTAACAPFFRGWEANPFGWPGLPAQEAAKKTNDQGRLPDLSLLICRWRTGLRAKRV